MYDGEQQPFNPLRQVIISVFAVLLIGIIFATGYILGARGGLQSLMPQEIAESGSLDQAFDVFWDVWNKIDREYYYDVPSTQDRVYGAVEGLVAGLGDDFSGFVTPQDAAMLREVLSNEYVGIGAVVLEAEGGGVYISRVFENSPADKAGMLAGDVVIGVDGEDITSDILDETVQKVRGPAGTSVVLTIQRPDVADPFDVTVTRAVVEYPSVETEIIDGRIGYIILYDFFDLSDERMERAVEDVMAEDVEGLIIDVRGNGGGYLDSVVSIADLFLDDGVILIEKETDGSMLTYRSYSGQMAETIPLVILVDENSASASEILAGAIQDRERGLLVGQTTFGKGSVQTLYDLPDESLLRLTTANWFTPNERTIQGNGITPDLIIDLPPLDDAAAPEEWVDTQLAAAVEALLEMIDNANE